VVVRLDVMSDTVVGVAVVVVAVGAGRFGAVVTARQAAVRLGWL